MPIDHSDLGAWLVKGDPVHKWDYRAARAEHVIGPGDAIADTWSLGRTYRNQLIGPGDLFVLYLSGPQAGIVEIGQVSGPLGRGRWDEDFVIDPDERNTERDFVPYRATLLTQPIPRRTLTTDPILSASEVIRVAQLANPSYLTREAVHALVPHISPRDLANSGWSTHPQVVGHAS